MESYSFRASRDRTAFMLSTTQERHSAGATSATPQNCRLEMVQVAVYWFWSGSGLVLVWWLRITWTAPIPASGSFLM